MPLSAVYREGDGQVDLRSNMSDVSLPEETRQADLGAIWREKITKRGQDLQIPSRGFLLDVYLLFPEGTRKVKAQPKNEWQDMIDVIFFPDQ